MRKQLSHNQPAKEALAPLWRSSLKYHLVRQVEYLVVIHLGRAGADTSKTSQAAVDIFDERRFNIDPTALYRACHSDPTARAICFKP
jgi:hypothetical protein